MPREYWRGQLNNAERKAYDAMAVSFARCNEVARCGKISPESVLRSYAAVCDDHPEFFYLPAVVGVQSKVSVFGSETEAVVHNLYDAAQIKEFSKKIDVVKNELKRKSLCLKNNEDKEKLICDYFLKNVTYEINNLYNQNAATVLLQNKGQCSGISRAAKLLLDFCGIETIVVSGSMTDLQTGRSGPHAWNIVSVDGCFYHLDVTSMLGANVNKSEPFKYSYLNYSDSEIRKNHIWNSATPQCSVCIRDFSEENHITVCSLYETREVLRKAIVDSAHSLTFISKIQLPREKLSVSIFNCCKDVFSKLNVKSTVSVSISDDEVTVSW